MNRRLTIADLRPGAHMTAPPTREPQRLTAKTAAPGSRAARAAANIERERIKREKAKTRREQRRALNLERLQQAYPGVFDPDHPKPLAIGCQQIIREEFGLKGTWARAVLGQWTQRTEYLRALIAPSAQRHLLDGTPVGPVTDKNREHAMRLINEKSPAPSAVP
jgi:hypothetical protein